MPPSAELTTARNALKTQRSALTNRLFNADLAEKAVRDAERRFAAGTSELTQVQQALTDANAAVDQTRAALATAEAGLQTAMSNWLGTLSVDADIARLDGQTPIVLFPVRVETRFDGNLLKVRVFPDEILFNSHETALTQEEYDAGKKYYQDLNDIGDTTELDNWRNMVGAFGAERSAYVLRILLPQFGDQTSSSSSSMSSIPDGQHDKLTFPTDIQFRPSTWSKPIEAVLPDRWVVMTRRGNTRAYFAGALIPEPLAVTLDPGSPASQQSGLPNGYSIDDRIRWTVDFDRAVQVGMGIQIPLSATDMAQGFDRLLVFGVKTSLSAGDTSTLVEQLLDAHHYTRGLALVRQGSATNNTKDAPTAFPPDDEAAGQSFIRERRPPPLDRFRAHPTLSSLSDGYAWTKFLGVPSGVAANIDRALEFEQLRANYMNRALWPVTYGSFLKFLMDPIFAQQNIDRAKEYFVNHVIARGPAPAFRVGGVPYGVLPITSLYRWQARTLGSSDDQAVEAALLPALRLMLPIRKNASKNVKRVKPKSATPDLDLLQALSLYPSSREMRVRFGLGEFLTYHIFNLFGWDVQIPFSNFDKLASDQFARIGHPEWRPRVGRTTYFPVAFLETTPFVDLDKNLSETLPLASDFLTGLSNALAPALINDVVANRPTQENLLYTLLRISTLTEYALQADQALRQDEPTTYVQWFNYEVFGLTSQPTQTVMSRLLGTTPFRGAPSLASYARSQSLPHANALAGLAGTPTAELNRLFTETLDVSSHRLDAWVTAFAARRLLALRSIEEQTQAVPTGSFFGGYAWVEDLRPAPRSTTSTPLTGTVETDPNNAGFIHTPGSEHATAAAVLRSAYKSYSPQDPKKFALDLSSRRVRIATDVLDELRDGQHVGAILGYRFERGLQEGHPGVTGLNQLRFVFRNLFPLVAGKNGVDTAGPAERAAARNVVDGLALYRAFNAGHVDFVNNPALPHPGSPQYTAVIAELNELANLVDAVADLLTAESVFQLARGNLQGALPSLDNLARGARPPSPEIAKSPRAGRGLMHRMAIVFPSDALPALPAGWPTTPTPRAAAEPVLDAWLGKIIGDPSKVVCQVAFKEADGTSGSARISLADLKLRPLDVLVISRELVHQNQGALLDARVVVAALGDDATRTDVVVDYSARVARDPNAERTFLEVLELANTLGSMLGGSKALMMEHLLSPADITAERDAAEPQAAQNSVELEARAAAAVGALNDEVARLANTVAALDPTSPTEQQLQALRDELRSAAHFAPERAFVPRAAEAQLLVDTASDLANEFSRRLAAAPAPADPSGPALARVNAAVAALKAVFGPDTFIMPQFDPPGADELAQSLGHRTTLIGSDERPFQRFVRQALHGRVQLGRYRKFSLYARAFGAQAPRADVVQLPFVPGEKWLGLPFDSAPEEGRSSLVLFSDSSALDPSVTWTGVLLETWTEIIPSKTQPTGIAFHYDTPRAEAPQCVLVAAPPTAATSWSKDDLVASLEETLDLAKVRAVDRELLDFNQLLPAIAIPNNLDQLITTSSGPIEQSVSVGSFFFQGFF